MNLAGGTRIHLLGIGGAGLSAIAELLLARGSEVSGCDVRDSAVIRALVEKGARITTEGQDPGHALGQDVLVYTTRLSAAARAEIDAAEAAGVEVMNRPQLLSGLIAGSDSVGIAGTHGKTTTTAMIGHVLRECGQDPTMLVGDGGSSRVGEGPLVAELDESDKSLPLHRPNTAIVTNVEFDHGDYYRDLADVQATFMAFLSGLPADGLAVTCADDVWLRAQAPAVRRVTYGYAEDADYRCGADGTVEREGRVLARIRLAIPGRHTLQNATAALAVAVERGIDPERVAAVLGSFPGAKRRLERLGMWHDAVLYDDYGHLPTEVRVTIDAVRELHHRRVLVVFQPHRFSRYLEMRDQLSAATSGADRVLITEIYPAGETNPGGVSSIELAGRDGCEYAADLGAARSWLEREVQADDLVLLMGAGNIRTLGDELARSG